MLGDKLLDLVGCERSIRSGVYRGSKKSFAELFEHMDLCRTPAATGLDRQRKNEPVPGPQFGTGMDGAVRGFFSGAMAAGVGRAAAPTSGPGSQPFSPPGGSGPSPSGPSGGQRPSPPGPSGGGRSGPAGGFEFVPGKGIIFRNGAGSPPGQRFGGGGAPQSDVDFDEYDDDLDF